jgi:uncharacterized protein
MLIYCDSAILIYYLDDTGAFQARAIARLAALWAAGDQIAASDLVRLECRVRPMRLGLSARLADFDNFFARPDVRLVPLTTAVYDRATTIRAAYNFKLADSLHLAAAVEGGCDSFLTNDARLSRFPDIPIEVLP